MIAETLIILFVIAIYKRYSFENLSSLPERAWGFLAAFIGIKVIVFLCIKIGVDFGGLRFFSLMSQTLLFAFLYFNRDYRGILLVFIGSLLNFIVMLLNGMRMPISGEYYQIIASPEAYQLTLNGASFHHFIMNEATNFKFLADVIPFYRPYPFPKVVSIGDILLAAGILVLGLSVLRGDYLDEKTD